MLQPAVRLNFSGRRLRYHAALFDLTFANATAYLAARPEAPPGPWHVNVLGGGVSNTVLLAENGYDRLVLKQSLAKLRVQEDWFADRTRIHRECAAMRRLARHLPAGAVPPIVFEDRPNCIFAMRASGPGARDWKSRLLAGEFSTDTAVRAARILAAQIRSSWQSPECEVEFGDQRSFDELRIDPYYRFTAGAHPGLAHYFRRLMTESAQRRVSLVHGDFSPKNLLVDGSRLTVIDFEVIHYGDPSFDSAFLLNHLLLKAVHMPDRAEAIANLARHFWSALSTDLPAGMDWFERATTAHLGCLHLARVDGKSPAEYLTATGRERARRLAILLIQEPPAHVLDAFKRITS